MESKRRFTAIVKTMLRAAFILAVVTFQYGCKPSENIQFEQFESVDASGWNWVDTKKFTFTIEEDQHYYNLICGLRITSEYAYSNIWMLYTLKGDNGYERKDQFQLVLSDDIGRWKGRGVSNLISYQEPFLTHLKLKKGTYTFEITQNMRDEELESVNNIGLQIVKGQLIL
jgi:gliding motility-associated lipoprotein GldH